MGAVSTFTKGNYPHQPSDLALFPLLSLVCECFIENMTLCARDKAKYRVLSMKWFTSISVLIYLAFLVFHCCCLVDMDMNMESTFHKYFNSCERIRHLGKSAHSAQWLFLEKNKLQTNVKQCTSKGTAT